MAEIVSLGVAACVALMLVCGAFGIRTYGRFFSVWVNSLLFGSTSAAVVAIVMLLTCAREVEKMIGSIRYLTVIGAGVLVALGSGYLRTLFGMSGQWGGVFFEVPWALLEVVCVAQCHTKNLTTQIFPSSRLSAVRAHHLPLGVVALSCVSCFVRYYVPPYSIGVDPFISLVAALTMWVTWACFRFIMRNPPTTFPFHLLIFPSPLRACVQGVGAVMWAKALELNLNLRAVSADGHDARGGVMPVPVFSTINRDLASPVILPGSTAEEAQRRRDAALAALSQRLQQQREKQIQAQDTTAPVAAETATVAQV